MESPLGGQGTKNALTTTQLNAFSASPPPGWYGSTVSLADFKESGRNLETLIGALVEAAKQSKTSTDFSGVIRKVVLFLDDYNVDDITSSNISKVFGRGLLIRHLQVVGATFNVQSITSIAVNLRSNSQLTILQLSSCGIDSNMASLIASSLERNHTLIELDLSLNDVNTVGAESIGKMLAVNCVLTRLVLVCSEIDSHGFVSLIEGLWRNSNTKIESLDLSNNRIYDASVSLGSFKKLFSSHHTLRYLYLRNVTIELNGGADISRALLRNQTLRFLDMPSFHEPVFPSYCLATAILKTLKMKHITWRMGLDASSLGPIVLSLRFSSHVNSFDFGGHFLGATGSVLLASCLRYNNAISVLNLLSCDLGDVGAVKLASSFSSLHCLASLSLADNHIGNLGMQSIASQISFCTQLISLDLRRNAFSSDGMSEIGKSLRQSRLVHLYLSYNDLSDCNVIMQSSFFSLETSNIENLDISRCSIGDTGFRLFCSAFSRCKTLRCISMDNNGLSVSSLSRLAEFLQESLSLHVLSIFEPEIEFSNYLPKFLNSITNTSIHCLNDSRCVNPIVMTAQKWACTREYLSILCHTFLRKKRECPLFDMNVIKEIWDLFGGDDCSSSMRLADASSGPEANLPS